MPTDKKIKIELTDKDWSTISRIVAEKSMEMHKKGATWMRGKEYLSCVDMGKIANKIQKRIGSEWDFETAFKPKTKIAKKAKVNS